MGAFDRARTILIPNDEKPEEAKKFREKWGWEPHEQVVLHGAFTAGIQEEIGNVATQMDEDGKPYMATGSARLVMMEKMIAHWTFTKGGQPVPVTLDAIRELPAEYQTPILEEIDKLAKRGMSKEAQKRFLPGANVRMRES
jgi:hypothetical protein